MEGGEQAVCVLFFDTNCNNDRSCDVQFIGSVGIALMLGWMLVNQTNRTHKTALYSQSRPIHFSGNSDKRASHSPSLRKSSYINSYSKEADPYCDQPDGEDESEVFPVLA